MAVPTDHDVPVEAGPRARMSGATSLVSMLASAALLAGAWNAVDGPSSRDTTIGIIFFAVCLALAFGLSLGAALRAPWVWKLPLIALATVSGSLIAVIVLSWGITYAH